MSYGLLMSPILLCPNEHVTDVPDDPGTGVSGPIHCGECGEKMMLATVGIIDREPDFATVNYRAGAGRGTWWK